MQTIKKILGNAVHHCEQSEAKRKTGSKNYYS